MPSEHSWMGSDAAQRGHCAGGDRAGLAQTEPVMGDVPKIPRTKDAQHVAACRLLVLGRWFVARACGASMVRGSDPVGVGVLTICSIMIA